MHKRFHVKNTRNVLHIQKHDCCSGEKKQFFLLDIKTRLGGMFDSSGYIK